MNRQLIDYKKQIMDITNMKQDKKQELFNDFENLLTTEEVASYLKIEKKKVYELYQIPNFPVIKLGRIYRVPKLLLFKWLKKTNSICDI